MVVVKPNMCAGLPVDLVNFKADNPLFPQEPTTDQFFSEAQWESYFHLGYTMGLRLTRRILNNLPRFAAIHFASDDGSTTVRDASSQVHTVTTSKRLPSRIAATGAVTASVSLGALATLGATAWQGVEQHIKVREDARKLSPVAFKELIDLYGKSATPGRLGEMATALLYFGDTTCTLDNIEAFRRSALMQTILTDTRRSCEEAASPRHTSCDMLLNPDRSVACLHEPSRINCEPRYWLRDFGETDPARQNCWVRPRSLPIASLVTAPYSWVSSTVSPPTAVCKGKTVYVQIFGPDLRDRVHLLREPWQKKLGADVPPVEDVLDTARRRSRNAPKAPSQPTVIYHDADSKDCADQLRPSDSASPWTVRPLSSQLSGMPGAIEVWIPSRSW